jgi:vacuolar-type H+-ATPase subunit H
METSVSFYTPNPKVLEQVAQAEHGAKLRLAAAREQARMDEGEPPAEHHELIRKLEAEWKQARERLHRVRHGEAEA